MRAMDARYRLLTALMVTTVFLVQGVTAQEAAPPVSTNPPAAPEATPAPTPPEAEAETETEPAVSAPDAAPAEAPAEAAEAEGEPDAGVEPEGREPETISDRLNRYVSLARPQWLEFGPRDWWERTREILHDRVEIGFKFKWYAIDDDRRTPDGDHDFLGSINAQKEDEELNPLFFINYRHNPYFAVGLGWDSVRSITWTQAEPEFGNPGYTDGTIEICGPVVYVAGYYPNESIYTPYVEAGLIFYGADFDHTNPDWHNAYGIPNYQYMDPSVDNGYRLGIGCDINVRGRIDAVVYLDQTWVDVELDHYLRDRYRQSGTFPLDHYSYGIGVKYRF